MNENTVQQHSLIFKINSLSLSFKNFNLTLLLNIIFHCRAEKHQAAPQNGKNQVQWSQV